MNDRSRALRSRSGERIVTRGSGVMEPRSFYRFRADIAPRLTSDVSHRFAARSVSLSRCFLTGGGGGGKKKLQCDDINRRGRGRIDQFFVRNESRCVINCIHIIISRAIIIIFRNSRAKRRRDRTRKGGRTSGR